VAVTPPPSGPSQAAGVTAGVLLGGRYRLDELLASGGMAQVWLGTDEVLRRAIALKILHQHLAADETFVTRFRHEAIAVAKLSHPSIVNVYDTCSDDGIEAIVMELVRGQTLRQRLDDGALDPWVAANIAAQVAGALAVAHAAGLVHRDIKPANILLSQDGRVKVGDFGIAKAAESADLTQEGSFLGTAKYLAPEQIEARPVDGRTDLYSLGVVLYEMLCGRVPFEADTASATALARLHNDPQRPRLVRAGVPRELEAITMRLLARDPASRFPTATDVRAALLGAGADDRAAAVDATAPEPLPTAPPPPPLPGTVPGRTPAAGSPVRFRDSERRWLVPTLLVVLVAVSLGVAGLLIKGSGDSLFGGSGDDDTQTGPTVQQPETAGVPIANVVDFDPTGGDGEHSGDTGNAIDGDPETTWTTERYNSPDWGGLKQGVGLILELEQPADLTALELDTPSSGWQAQVYVADRVADSLDEWGPPVASFDDTESGTARTELEAEGSAVLVWFTRAGNTNQMVVEDVRLER
jgi:tRNA A-37 threonylcarbamoyl transferase component Bud32